MRLDKKNLDASRELDMPLSHDIESEIPDGPLIIRGPQIGNVDDKHDRLVFTMDL